jgi:hypothetical protein
MPVQQDVPLGRWRYLGDECEYLSIAARLVLRQQPRQDGRVVVDESVGDQLGALVANFDLNVGAPGQRLLAANLGNGPA